MKSGIGLFGSPQNSPLTFHANFNPNSGIPTFSLTVKPKLGNFSLFKAIDSRTKWEGKVDGQTRNGELGNGSDSDYVVTGGSEEREKGLGLGLGLGLGSGWKDSSILSGILVAARTSMPVTKRALVNFRWCVSFPAESEVSAAAKPQFPMLVMNKISLERVEEMKKEEEEKGKVIEAKTGDLELLKGMCSWMSREMEVLQRENKEMKKDLEGMRGKGSFPRRRYEEREKDMVLPKCDSFTEFEKWRGKKGNGNVCGGEENGKRESDKATRRMSEVESELQKAIKAAGA